MAVPEARPSTSAPGGTAPANGHRTALLRAGVRESESSRAALGRARPPEKTRPCPAGSATVAAPKPSHTHGSSLGSCRRCIWAPDRSEPGARSPGLTRRLVGGAQALQGAGVVWKWGAGAQGCGGGRRAGAGLGCRAGRALPSPACATCDSAFPCRGRISGCWGASWAPLGPEGLGDLLGEGSGLGGPACAQGPAVGRPEARGEAAGSQQPVRCSP